MCAFEEIVEFSPNSLSSGSILALSKKVICSNGCVDLNFWGAVTTINYLVVLKPTQNLLLCVSSMINKQFKELAATVS